MPSRTIVITGASDGIGAAAARRLSRSGENVVVVGRCEPKTRAVAAESGSDFFVADFSDLAQVRALAKCLLERYPRIDVLANNAGGMATKPEITADGFEKTFQVNYLAPFLLTTMLTDRLLESRAAVLNTTSASQRLLGRVNVADMEHTQRFRPSKTYALSKLAVVLFTQELHRRYHRAGLSAATFHPGYINSNFGVASGSKLLRIGAYTPITLFIASADRGSDQLVWLASGTPGLDWRPGEYYSRHKVARANRLAYDPAFAGALWQRSLQLVGL